MIRGKGIEERKIIPLSELPLADDFMFGEVMRREDICILFLEALLGKQIDHIEYIERQQDLSDDYESHGIRLDVYLKDEKGTVYNIEMQRFSGDNLEMRVRYYQSGIDRRTLEKGVHYADLKESYVIFVCAFDYFEHGLAVYERKSFMMGAKEDDYSIEYEDGSHIFFLNSKYKTGNADRAILEYLDYLRTDDNTRQYNSKLVQRVKEAVEDVRHDKSKEEPYMTMTMKLEDMHRAGYREGVLEGIEQTIIQNEKQLMEKENWSFTKACDVLAVPNDIRTKIYEIFQK